jgi:hypothetical protein
VSPARRWEEQVGENEQNAAVKGGTLLSVIVVISGFGLWRLIKIGSRSSEKAHPAKTEG